MVVRTLTHGDRVLIAGGYGRAGTDVARTLRDHLPELGLRIGGRNPERARRLAERLEAEAESAGASNLANVEAVALDTARPASLARALDGCTLLIGASPLSGDQGRTMLEVALDAGVDVLDLVPDAAKRRAFAALEARLRSRGRVAVIEAGFNPGLPAVLTRWAATRVSAPARVRIASLYSDRAISEAGVRDILEHMELGGERFAEGRWRRSGPLALQRIDYGAGFGRRLSLPISLPELRALPQRLGLRQLDLYSAGFNPVADTFLALSTMLAAKRNERTAAAATRAIRFGLRCTPPPFGGAMRVQAQGNGNGDDLDLTLHHPDLYRATAISVVAGVEQLLLGRIAAPGGFLGHAVQPGPFMAALERLGMRAAWRSSRPTSPG